MLLTDMLLAHCWELVGELWGEKEVEGIADTTDLDAGVGAGVAYTHMVVVDKMVDKIDLEGVAYLDKHNVALAAASQSHLTS